MKFPVEKTAKWLGIALLAFKLTFLAALFVFFDEALMLFDGTFNTSLFEKACYSSAKARAERDIQVLDSVGSDSDTAEIFRLPYDFLKVKSLPADFPEPRLKRMARSEILANGIVGDNQATLFFGGGGVIWINLSHDGGKTWRKLYSGLFWKKSYEILDDLNLPLWKNDSVLQFRIRINRRIGPDVLPVSFESTHEAVSDRYVAEIDLGKMSRDSDGDGLTDVMEMRYMTNPISKDTDNDGISDDKDLNPRFSGSTDPESLLYSGFVEERLHGGWNGPAWYSDRELMPGRTVTGDVSTPAVLLVTDEPALQRIIPCRTKNPRRYIIMSRAEFRKYRETMPDDFDGFGCMYVSPLYPADLMKGTYWVSFEYYVAREEFMVKRTCGGWKVFDMGGFII